MIQALIAPSTVDLAAIAGALGRLGIELVPISWNHAGPYPPAEIPPALDQAVLVQPTQGVVPLGEHVAAVRRYVGSAVPLLVCCPQMSAAQREEIVRCGASLLISPRAWQPAAVAERILAEVIAAGTIQPSSCGSLQGATAAMQALYRDLATVAPLTDPVLVLGETGTGKELIAREAHRMSGRSGSLLAINCAAITPDLLESELFGHERGAFSGAVTARRGLLVEAGHGTVFLDEIGDLAPSAQAKLLRVLEERKVRPVGSNAWQPVHARILLATHRDLETASQDGGFRQDLYERIRGFTLRLPPLRERRADLVLLLQHFVHEYNLDYPGRRTVPVGAADALFRHTWPGNVRELRQIVRKAAAFAGSDQGPISVLTLVESLQRHRPPAAGAGIPFDPLTDSWRAVHDRAQAAYFRALMEQTGGSKEAAAKRAGLGRSQFYVVWKQIEGSGDAGDGGDHGAGEGGET